MVRKQVPKRLWDYLLIWICETSSLSVSSSKYANGRTSLEIITGETPDISEYLDFGFYEWVNYRTNAGLGETSLGRWLGVSHKIGQLMSYWILPVSGKPISCVTVQPLTPSEKSTNEYIVVMNKFDESIAKRLVIQNSKVTFNSNTPEWNRLSLDEYDESFIKHFENKIDNDTIPHADTYTSADFDDTYINMELGLPRGPDGDLHHATMKSALSTMKVSLLVFHPIIQ